MLVGYARVSTRDQNESRQLDAFKSYGVDLNNVFIDKASGKSFKRPQYQLMLKTLRAGDILVIKSIDRLGREYDTIKKEFKEIIDKGVHIHVLDMPILNTDQKIAEGLTAKFIVDLVLGVLSYVAQQEREFIRQRQAEGIRSARARKVKLGRPNLNKDLLIEAHALITSGASVKDVCQSKGISRATYYNYLKTL